LNLLSFLGWIYLLRIPLLTGIGFAGVCFAAFFTGAKSLLGGAFDINYYVGIFWVSLIAFLFASAVEVAWRLVRSYGPQRFFDDTPTNSKPGPLVNIGHSLMILLVALAPIGAAIYSSTELSFPYNCEDLPFIYECKVLSSSRALVWAFLGFAVYLALIAIVAGVQLLFNRPAVATRSPDLFLLSAVWPVSRLFDWLRRSDPIGWLAELIILRLGPARMDRMGQFAAKITAFFRRFQRFPSGLGRGYFEYENDRVVSILPGHITALALFLLTFMIYVWIGKRDYSNLMDGTPTTIPTLCYVLLLFTLLCWGFSSLAFLLDSYRIPVLVPVVALLFITSFTPGLRSDYYYPVMKPVDPDPKGSVYSSDEPMIVVAVTGGGIQSASWAARVLTGLEAKCREVKCAPEFDESIRVISAVSGGSVGTMYFLNEYKGGHLPGNEPDSPALEKIVARAERSSLDYVLWGLLYPDLARLVIPWPFKEKWDRGRALERAWSRDTGAGINELLSEWRNDTRINLENENTDDNRPARPAVIFNSTVTESGQRLPLTTTERLEYIAPPKRVLSHEDLFEKGKAETDVSVVTATRLSATFPYVSPAARADVKGPAAHLVDGGYYDNYGVSSLVEWLDAEFENNPGTGRKVLVLEIHGAGGGCASGGKQTSEEQTGSPEGTEAPDGRTQQIRGNRGWFYQAFAPLWTVLNVRGPAQRGNNEVALDLLIGKWDEKGEKEDDEDVDFTRAIFSFDGPDPPTSWHLTEKQKLDIQYYWEAELDEECNNDQGWDKVASFLGTQARDSG
jgi:Patatin-like phospholipase